MEGGAEACRAWGLGVFTWCLGLILWASLAAATPWGISGKGAFKGVWVGVSGLGA